MATIDYKEKYEAALERCKKLYNEAKANGYTSDIEDYETIFPELAESEDERIRKALMQNLKERFGTKGNMGKGLDMPDVLAWFEKQGEKGTKGNDREIPNSEQKPNDKVDQHSLPVSDNSSLPTFDESIYHPCTEEAYEQKPAEWSEEDERIRKDIVTYLKSAIANKGYRDKIIESWIDWLEKQGEKTEPIEDFDTEFERQISHLVASIINKEYSYTKAFVKWTSGTLLNYAKHEIEKQGEQKSAWSQKDERIYQSIMDDTVQENQLNDKQTNWLKDIKYRYFPQPRQEWNEEDEKQARQIERIVHDDGCTQKLQKQIADWLKSLKNRCTWKPSEEQMFALNIAIEMEDGDILKSLYQDLLKLKEK